jgi:hypothetical protein
MDAAQIATALLTRHASGLYYQILDQSGAIPLLHFRPRVIRWILLFAPSGSLTNPSFDIIDAVTRWAIRMRQYASSARVRFT